VFYFFVHKNEQLKAKSVYSHGCTGFHGFCVSCCLYGAVRQFWLWMA